MFRQKVILATISVFLVGVIVSTAYMITTGMFNPLHNLVAMSNSWATEEATEANWIVSQETVVQKQSIYLCGDVETEESSDAKGLMGMSQAELVKVFDVQDGWQVQFLSPEELVLARRVNELCPKHQGYRHLSIHQDRMAIFQGPLGIDMQLLKVVRDKDIRELPQSMQLKLQQASEFYNQAPEIQTKLQKELEFSSEKQLNAVLENIDELD